MEENLTPEMEALIMALGKLVKEDPRHAALRGAMEDYERSEELNELVSAYNEKQSALTDAYAGAETPDPDAAGAVQDEIDALYDKIVNHPVYLSYMQAKAAFDALTGTVFSELQYAVTGRRACTHDCASCGGCR